VPLSIDLFTGKYRDVAEVMNPTVCCRTVAAEQVFTTSSSPVGKSDADTFAAVPPVRWFKVDFSFWLLRVGDGGWQRRAGGTKRHRSGGYPPSCSLRWLDRRT
jgi:hypothetical protein